MHLISLRITAKLLKQVTRFSMTSLAYPTLLLTLAPWLLCLFLFISSHTWSPGCSLLSLWDFTLLFQPFLYEMHGSLHLPLVSCQQTEFLPPTPCLPFLASTHDCPIFLYLLTYLLIMGLSFQKICRRQGFCMTQSKEYLAYAKCSINIYSMARSFSCSSLNVRSQLGIC